MRSVVPLLNLLLMFQGIAELLGAEGGVSLGSGLGGQARVKHAVAREAVGDGKDGKYGGAQVHSHCRRRGVDAERGRN